VVPVVVAAAVVLPAAVRPAHAQRPATAPDSAVVPRRQTAPVSDSARTSAVADTARPVVAPTVAVAGASPAAGGVAEAGAPAPGTWAWERSLELAGNYLYGNNEQAVFSTRGSVARRNARWEMRLDGRFLVGASNRAGDRVMDRRSWLIGANVDYRPNDLWSEFFLASAERSFELRVDHRVTAGAGVKYVIDCDTIYRLDMSVALLGEANALPQPVAGQPGAAPIVRNELARLSGRLRYRNQFTDRLNFDVVTWYRPELAALDRFLASGTVGVQYQVNRIAGLRFSVQHDYDSLARSRGARSNQNGQVLVGVNTRF
jgi:hypothetical protein